MMNMLQKQLKKNKKGRKGFTLMELLVVVAIIGILVLIAVPRFLAMTDGATGRTFEANHRIIVSAVAQFTGDNAGAVPADLAALAPYISGGVASLTNAPATATYVVANGTVTSTLPGFTKSATGRYSRDAGNAAGVVLTFTP